VKAATLPQVPPLNHNGRARGRVGEGLVGNGVEHLPAAPAKMLAVQAAAMGVVELAAGQTVEEGNHLFEIGERAVQQILEEDAKGRLKHILSIIEGLQVTAQPTAQPGEEVLSAAVVQLPACFRIAGLKTFVEQLEWLIS
jgi:hypothetical protein